MTYIVAASCANYQTVRDSAELRVTWPWLVLVHIHMNLVGFTSAQLYNCGHNWILSKRIISHHCSRLSSLRADREVTEEYPNGIHISDKLTCFGCKNALIRCSFALHSQFMQTRPLLTINIQFQFCILTSADKTTNHNGHGITIRNAELLQRNLNWCLRFGYRCWRWQGRRDGRR